MSRIRFAAFAALAMIGAAHPAAAATLFADDFSGDIPSPAASITNFASFTNFTVSDGTVDLIAEGGFGLTCGAGQTGCVDLDGSTGNGGVLQTTALSLTAGEAYTLELLIGGNQRGGASDAVALRLFNGTDPASVIDTLTFAFNDPLAVVTLPFSVAASGAWFVQIEDLGGDNTGAILSSVTVLGPDAEVPLPAAAPLLLGALGALGLAARRRAG